MATKKTKHIASDMHKDGKKTSKGVIANRLSGVDDKLGSLLACSTVSTYRGIETCTPEVMAENVKKLMDKFNASYKANWDKPLKASASGGAKPLKVKADELTKLANAYGLEI